MQIQLMRCTAEAYRVDKSEFITNTFTCNGNLKDETSVTDPSFLIEKTTPPIKTQYNYCYIPQFERYYFIRDFDVVHNNMWRVSCHVDVLYTYMAEILNNKVIIEKAQSASDANLYLNDGSFVVDARKYNRVINFPGGLSETGHNILICAGGE